MAQRSLRAPPDLDAECPRAADPAIATDLRASWTRRHPDLQLRVTTGEGAAAVVVVTGPPQRALELFVFARGPGAPDLSGPLAVVVDVADALLQRLAAGDELRTIAPLDWEGAPRGQAVVFVRGERRDYLAEEQAAALLQEEPPQRALPRA